MKKYKIVILLMAVLLSFSLTGNDNGMVISVSFGEYKTLNEAEDVESLLKANGVETRIDKKISFDFYIAPEMYSRAVDLLREKKIMVTDRRNDINKPHTDKEKWIHLLRVHYYILLKSGETVNFDFKKDAVKMMNIFFENGISFKIKFDMETYIIYVPPKDMPKAIELVRKNNKTRGTYDRRNRPDVEMPKCINEVPASENK